MLKILHIIPELSKGGAERLVIDICETLIAIQNIEICLVTFRDRNLFVTANTHTYHRIIHTSFTPSISKKAITNISDLQSFIYDYNPNIIHSHLWESEIVLSQIVIGEATWFTHFHDNMIQLNNSILPISKKTIGLMYERQIVLKSYRKNKKTFICISHDTQKYAENMLPRKYKNNITLLHNAIKYNRFINTQETQKDNSIFTLVNVGSFVPKKNQGFLINIVSILITKGINVKLHLIGEGSEKSNIEKEIIEKQLQSNVILHGHINEVEKIFWQSDIYVHSAYYEPFGLVLLEAMAAGLPVVCLDGGGNRDIIEQGKNGFMIEQQNAELFANKIIELHQNKVLYKRISDYAQEFAKRYDIKEYVDKLLEIYKSAPKSIV